MGLCVDPREMSIRSKTLDKNSPYKSVMAKDGIYQGEEAKCKIHKLVEKFNM
jgi:hypothetical protein